VNWTQYSESLEGVRRGTEALERLGRVLSGQLAELVESCHEGEEDRALVALCGEAVAKVARRTGWSSLVINPGSTSTKVAVYSGLNLVARDEVYLEPGESDSVERRCEHLLGWLGGLRLSLGELSGIAVRGGFMAPLPCGTYGVCEQMRIDLETAPYRHAANLGVPMALSLARRIDHDIVLTTTDPLTCDELSLARRVTGSPRLMVKGSAAHYLNMRALVRLLGHSLSKAPEELHVAVCHMGGDMSAGRWCEGRFAQVVKVFGHMPSAERSGGLPLDEVLRLAEQRQYTFEEMRGDVLGNKGGLLALAGTTDFRAFVELMSGPLEEPRRRKAEAILEFFVNQAAAAILELFVSDAPLDAVVLSGGLAANEVFFKRLSAKLPLIAPLVRVPGSVEAQALCAGLIKACADPLGRKSYAQTKASQQGQLQRDVQILATPLIERKTPRWDPKAPITSLDELLVAARPHGAALPTIAVCGADNEEALLAARLACASENRLARFVLIGPYAKVSQLAWELDVPIDEENTFILDSTTPVAQGIELLDAGIADILMKGGVMTADILGGYFQYLKARGLSGGRTKLGHIGLFEIPGRSKLVAVSDAAINPAPDVETRLCLLDNAVSAMHKLGIARPKVAVISSIEKPTPKVISSVEGREIAERCKDREDMIIDGPLSVDLALSPECAHEKGYRGRIQGDADLLLVPTLDVGNAIYKAFTVTGGATIAGAVIGGNRPLVLTSRGDSARSKLSSIALALVLAQAGEERKPS
jgi:phosphate butyryltransferase